MNASLNTLSLDISGSDKATKLRKIFCSKTTKVVSSCMRTILSLGKESKHINVKCFFAVDKIEKKDARIACYPAEKIVTDYSTKLN